MIVVRNIAIMFLLIGLIFLVGCSLHSENCNFKPAESPHLYWKDIDVVITDIDKSHWYASAHHYKIHLTVESDEYRLTESFDLIGSKAKEKWNWNKGDTVKAELFSWVMDSTGEVLQREIHQVY